MSFFENTRRPEGFGGKLMVSMMNLGHAALAEWGLQHLAGFLSWLCHGWSLLFAHRHRKRTVNFLDCPLGLGM